MTDGEKSFFFCLSSYQEGKTNGDEENRIIEITFMKRITVFYLLTRPGIYLITMLLNVASVRGGCLKEGDAFLKVRMTKNKLNLKTLSFYYFSLKKPIWKLKVLLIIKQEEVL